MAKVGTLKCDIKIDTTKFQAAVASVRKAMSGFGVSVSQAAAAVGDMNKSLAKTEKEKAGLTEKESVVPSYPNCKCVLPSDFPIMESSLISVPANPDALVEIAASWNHALEDVKVEPKVTKPKHRRVVTFEKDSP